MHRDAHVFGNRDEGLQNAADPVGGAQVALVAPAKVLLHLLPQDAGAGPHFGHDGVLATLVRFLLLENAWVHDGVDQEAKNRSNIPLQEKFHSMFFLRDLINISHTPVWNFSCEKQNAVFLASSGVDRHLWHVLRPVANDHALEWYMK